MRKSTGILLLILFSLSAIAGGNNEFVKFPGEYKNTFNFYSTQNRQNGNQVADLYANDIAMKSAAQGDLAEGSILIMEIYKTETGEDNKPVTGADGIFKRTKLAAVAVMEKRSNWDPAFPADERAGNWGFALYDPEGMPKDNDLDCASCHKPLSNQDFMFSIADLKGK